MSHSVAQNLLDNVKLEPLNYYLNSPENGYLSYSNCGYVTPEVSISYDNLKNDSERILELCSRNHVAQEVTIKTEDNNKPEKKSKSQICKICNKTLASASSYYVHMKQHSNSKPYLCTRCDASFCRKPYLEVHMRVHTGEKPYQCDICQKRFTQKSSLNTHKRCHSGIRPYSCHICLKTFTVKSYLTAHRWTHISDTGIKCKECEVSFSNKHMYLQHMQMHISREFECSLCSKAFAKESYLIRHVNKIHKKSD